MATNKDSNSEVPMLHGIDIANVLSSSGPIVKCVLLKAGSPPSESQKPAAITKGNDDENTAKTKENEASTTVTEVSNEYDGQAEVQEDDEVIPEKREVLVDLMEEIEIDTTPSKSMVAKTLGGPFTFLGQYEDEGIVLMVRQPRADDDEDGERDDDGKQKQPLLPTSPFDRGASLEELKSQSIKDLRKLCGEKEISTEGMLEKGDLIEALLNDMEARHEQEAKLQIVNPHQLQPPLHNVQVRGDILVMKVAPTEETLDDEDEDDDDDENDSDEQGTSKEKEIVVPSNDEFFLDYTKDQYIEFASRTDIVEPDEDEEEDSSEEEGSEDEADAEEADAYMFGEDGEPDEQDKNAMLNMVMNEVLRQFREDNGRGPDTLELLEIRSSVAKQLDIEMPDVDEIGADWNQKANRKKDDGAKKRDRRIAFSPDTKSGAPLGPVDEDDEEEDEEYTEESARKKPRIDADGEAIDEEDAIQK